jgi:hypothetical protein
MSFEEAERAKVGCHVIIIRAINECRPSREETFMLWSPLVSKAESFSGLISIMTKGCMYII